MLSFSFDYGFSQLSTAFAVGASVVLLDYLLPQEVLLTLERERITGLAAVPPIWIQLADLRWPDERAPNPALHHQLRRRDAARPRLPSCGSACRRRACS